MQILLKTLIHHLYIYTNIKQEIYLAEIENEGEHWRRCAFYTNKAFGFVTGAMYVNETERGATITQVRERERDF